VEGSAACSNVARDTQSVTRCQCGGNRDAGCENRNDE
jgi:hypothetical protein